MESSMGLGTDIPFVDKLSHSENRDTLQFAESIRSEMREGLRDMNGHIKRDIAIAVDEMKQDLIQAVRESSSMQRASEGSGQIKKPKSELHVPIHYADLLIFKAASISIPGYLNGSTTLRRCGLNQHDTKNVSTLPLGTRDSIFRVCPSLNYVAQEEIVRMQPNGGSIIGKRSSIAGRGSVKSMSSNKSRSEEMRTLRVQYELEKIRAEDEIRQNKILQERLMSGWTYKLQYGDVVQLQHVQSELFIACHESASLRDSDCRRVELHKGGSSCYFRVKPKMRYRNEGAPVYFDDEILLESVKLRGHFLHVSNLPYDEILFPRDFTIPKSLSVLMREAPVEHHEAFIKKRAEEGNTVQKVDECRLYESCLECNCSNDGGTTFTVMKYASYTPQTQHAMKTLQNVRLFHPEAEAFLHASCDADKDGYNSEKRENGEPAHIPYLKVVNENKPENTANHSGKGVWTFEVGSRAHGDVIKWNSPIRIRHVPSGQYLAVDSKPRVSEELAGRTNEQYYSLFFVNDTVNDDGDDQTLFYFQSNEAFQSKALPDTTVAVRVEHRSKHNGILFLHDTQEIKPRLLRNINNPREVNSVSVVMSTVRHTADVFLIVPLSHKESLLLTNTLSSVPVAKLYSYLLQDISEPLPGGKEVSDEIDMLLGTIDNCTTTGTSMNSKEKDWVKEANSMLPTAFSRLFRGVAEPTTQRVCRECKLMNAVFEMTNAPYNRAVLQAPPGVEPKAFIPGRSGRREMFPVRAVQKLAYVALQRMCHQNKKNQMYFSRQKANRKQKTESGAVISVTSDWIFILTSVLNDPLGAAVTLSNLLSSNETLVKTYVNDKLMEDFVGMILTVGPQPRLINFFEQICSVDNRAIKANQEMVLRKLWIDKDRKQKCFIEIHEIYTKPLPDSQRTTKSVSMTGPVPGDYLGKEDDDKTDQRNCYVSWNGNDNWVPGCGDLWFTPHALGIDGIVTHSDRQAVPIEQFLWVLDPRNLCQKVTGVKYEAHEACIRDDHHALEKFQNHEQLAGFLVTQTQLFVKMCAGDSNNCIRHISRDFTYIKLINLCSNGLLPGTFRATCCDLMRFLYIERYPQLRNCGRPCLPELLWIYEASDAPEGVPVIGHVPLSSPLALPQFRIARGHPLLDNPDPFMNFPNAYKFYLVRRMIMHFLDDFGGAECRVVLADREQNSLLNAIMRLVEDLFSFGFISDLHKIEDVMGPIMRILDGTTDTASHKELYDDYTDNEGDVSSDGSFIHEGMEVEGNEGFLSPSDRWNANDVNAIVVTRAKFSIVEAMEQVSNFRANFRLSRMLCVFKDLLHKKNGKGYTMLRNFHVDRKKPRADQADNTEELYDNIYVEFEKLFTDSEGVALDLQTLSGGQNFNAIMLDLLMYEDDNLFETAVRVFKRRFGQRQKLLDSVRQVTLLVTPDLPVFEVVATLESDLGYFRFLIRSAEVWGVQNRISGDFKMHDLDETLHLANKLIDFMKCSSISSRQVQDHSRNSAGNEMSPLVGIQKGPSDSDSDSVLSSRRESEDIDSIQNPIATNEPNQVEMISLAASPLLNNDRHIETAAVDTGIEGTIGYVNPMHQNLLRTMDLQTSLLEALRIDYNIAFYGSKCTDEDRVKSRSILVKVLRVTIDVLIHFVKDNQENQNNVAAELPTITQKFMGPLVEPDYMPGFDEDLKVRIRSLPPFNAPMLVIETLRGNTALCKNPLIVTEAMIKAFAEMLNADPNPSTSPFLDFFFIVCMPTPSTAVRDNQAICIRVLWKMNNIKTQLMGLLDSHTPPPNDNFDDDSSPGNLVIKRSRMLRLLIACIGGGNARVASRLSGQGFSIPRVVAMAINSISLILPDSEDLLGNDEDDQDLLAFGGQTLEDFELAKCTIQLLALQLQVLGINHRLVDDKSIWDLLGRLSKIFKSFEAQNTDTMMDNDADIYQDLTEHGLSVVESVLRGAKSANLLQNVVEERNHIVNPIQDIVLKIFNKRINESCRDIIDKIIRLVEPEADQILDDLHGKTMLQVSRNLMNSSSFSHVSRQSDVETHFRYFLEGITTNPKIEYAIKRRHFEFLNCLENATIWTGPEKKDPTVDSNDRDQISWNDLVLRFARYLKNHLLDSDSKTSIIVCDFLRGHLVKSRCDEEGVEQEINDLSTEAMDDYVGKQNNLNEKGITSLIAECLSIHHPGEEGDLPDSAIELIIEMLRGGNTEVQREIVSFLVKKDHKGGLFSHFQKRLNAHDSAIRARREEVKTRYKKPSTDMIAKFHDTIETCNLLQLLCEGHNFQLQNLMRVQPHCQRSINLMGEVISLLILQVESAGVLRRLDKDDLSVVEATMEFIIEALQGPCPENQKVVAQSQCIQACTQIISSPFSGVIDHRVNGVYKIFIKGLAIKLLAATLEGRDDKICHNDLAAGLNPALFDSFHTELRGYLDMSKKRKSVGDDYRNEIMEILCDLECVQRQLSMVKKEFKSFAYDDSDLIGYVEVNWNGRTEPVCFVLPRDHQSLQASVKQEFLHNADLSSSEKRMKQLVEVSDDFIFRTKHLDELETASSAYRLAKPHVESFRWFIYGLVLILNLNRLMDYEGDDYKYTLTGLSKSKKGDIISCILAVFIIFGYGTIVTFVALTEVPILWQKAMNNMEESDEKKVMTRDVGAFTSLLVAFGGYCSFIILRTVYFPADAIYWEVMLIVFLPWTIMSLRNYVVVPDKPVIMVLCLVYHSIVQMNAIRNTLVCMCICIAGLFHRKVFFTVLLFDIFTLSDDLSAVTQAIYKPIKEIGITFYVIAVSSFVFTAFAFDYKTTHHDWEFFYDDQQEIFIQIDDDENDDSMATCHTLFDCTLITWYKAIPSGDIGSVLDGINAVDTSTSEYAWRVFFDLVFFIWVGVLLFNILTGLMVDTFSALREENETRAANLRNECFVCGYTRSAYEDLGGDYYFDTHAQVEHDVWSYLFFIAYLKQKDHTECNGVETYVLKMFEREDLDWVPARTSWRIENAMNAKDGEENVEIEIYKRFVKDQLRDFRETLIEELRVGDS